LRQQQEEYLLLDAFKDQRIFQNQLLSPVQQHQQQQL